MPSDLYRRALDTLLDDEKTSFRTVEEWLDALDSSGDPSRDGAKLLANLQAESHLVGDRDFGDPAELAGFLRRCASHCAALEPDERPGGYVAACQEFAGRGLRIPRDHLPAELLRYSPSRTLAAILIERMLGKRARDAFDLDALPAEIAFARLRDHWSAPRLDVGDRLARREPVFATFEHPAGAPRMDATALSRALALPLWQGPRTGTEKILVELTYSTDAVEDHRFPTVADAGWIHLFHPAPEEAPRADLPASCCGWTAPLDAHPPQPEIVHRNAPLAVLSEPPRFVGSIA